MVYEKRIMVWVACWDSLPIEEVIPRLRIKTSDGAVESLVNIMNFPSNECTLISEYESNILKDPLVKQKQIDTAAVALSVANG